MDQGMKFMIAKLRELAKDADGGIWQSRHHGVFVGDNKVCLVHCTTGHYESEESNRDWIAAACPENIIALIDALESKCATKPRVNRKR